MVIDPMTSRKIAILQNILPLADVGEFLKITNFIDKEKWLINYLNSEKGQSLWSDYLKSQKEERDLIAKEKLLNNKEAKKRNSKLETLSNNISKTLNFLDKPEFDIFKTKFNQTFGVDFKDVKNIYINGSAPIVDIKKEWFKDWFWFWAVIPVENIFCIIKKTGSDSGHFFGCFESHEQAEEAIIIINSAHSEAQDEIDSFGGSWFGQD